MTHLRWQVLHSTYGSQEFGSLFCYTLPAPSPRQLFTSFQSLRLAVVSSHRAAGAGGMVFSRATSGSRFLYHTGFWEPLKSPLFRRSAWTVSQERQRHLDSEGRPRWHSASRLLQLCLSSLKATWSYYNKNLSPYRAVGRINELNVSKMLWRGKGLSMPVLKMMTTHCNIAACQTVSAFDLLPALLLQKVFTWAGSTSTSSIPSPTILPHLWKKSAMPQLNCAIREWNFEQQLPRRMPILGPLFPWKQGTQQA